VIALAIETSGVRGSVALRDDARGLLAEVAYDEGLRHGAAIVPSIERALAEAKLERRAIDLLVAGVGPGSYTGLRVGIATAKALAFALKRPAVGVASFDALAASLDAAALAGARSLVVAADARRERLYAGVYNVDTRARVGDFKVVPAARLFEGLEGEVALAGYALERHPQLRLGFASTESFAPSDAPALPRELQRARAIEAHPPAREVARLGIEAWRANPAATLHDVKPLYLTPGLAGAEE
jgi:tRNA threonylcarbamoyladenosine biosynthesis protein TsaB